MYSESAIRHQNLSGIYLFKVNNENTRKMCGICLKLTIKIPERCHVFIVNFQHISHIDLVFSMLNLTGAYQLGINSIDIKLEHIHSLLN